MPQNSSIYRFGVFELDPRSAELRKNGVRLRLQDQPYQVLLKLVENPGEVVSREELRAALWHDDTFVDFETGVNTAVKRLRETLGDSADNPTFVETLPRRGYRFIASVERTVEQTKIGVSDRPSKQSRNLVRHIGLAAGVAALFLICLAYWRKLPGAPVVTSMKRITNDGKPKNPLNPPVTDGVHLYFTEGMPYTTGGWIAQVSAAGGETTRLTTAVDNVWAVSDVSANGSELLFSKSGNESTLALWVQPLPGGAPHPVGNIKALLATWTPDGKHIVYGDGDAVMVANKDGTDPHQVAKVHGLVFSIQYSPDGRRIRFDLTDPNTDSNSIWEMDANGKNIHPVFPGWKESPVQSAGHWSPDGNYYYFQAGNGDSQAIWVMPERHSIFGRHAKGPTRLAAGPIHFSNPVPSGDGKRVFVLGEEPRVELVRYRPKDHRFDSYLPGLSAGPVHFSPDGEWVTYVTYPEMSLWRSRMDGSEKMQLTFPPVRAYLPRWSPDGSRIAFMDVRFDSPWRILVVSPSGGIPELVSRSNSYEADPTWMADGKSIVFGASDKLSTSAIYVLELQTKKVSALPGSDGLFSPRVSPDGRYISALTMNQSKMMLFDTQSNRWTSLVEGEQLGYNEWSHDGSYIYFRANRNGAGELARVKVNDRVVEKVLSLKGFPQLSDGMALWIGLTPDDLPLLMKDRSVQEIYALDLEFR